jgi:hypothetical protein
MRDKIFKVRKYLSPQTKIQPSSNPEGWINPVFQLISEFDCTTPYSYTTFLDKLEQYLKLFPSLRLGQAMYTLVDALDSAFNDDVCGYDSDPFWNDENIPRYLILAFKRGIFKF